MGKRQRKGLMRRHRRAAGATRSMSAAIGLAVVARLISGMVAHRVKVAQVIVRRRWSGGGRIGALGGISAVVVGGVALSCSIALTTPAASAAGVSQTQDTSLSVVSVPSGAAVGDEPSATAQLTVVDGGASVTGRILTFTLVAPDGTVESESGTTNASGSATVTFAPLTQVGTWSVQATFTGDTAYSASTSAPSAFQVRSNIAVSTAPATGTAGTAVQLVAMVRTIPDGSPVTNASLKVDFAITGPCGQPYAMAGTTDNTGTATVNFTPPFVGQYAVVATVEGTPLYGSVAAAPVSLTVTAAPQSPSIPVCVRVTGGQTYGGSPTFTVPSPLPAGVMSSGPVTCPTVNGGTAIAATLGVKSYTIDGPSCTGLNADSDHVLTVVGGSFVVAPATLTITASSLTVPYGQAFAVTPAYGGFVAGDTAASLTTQPTCTSTAPANPAPGTYSTSCGGAFDGNYMISYIMGTLTVDKAATTMKATPAATGLLSLTFSATLTRSFDHLALRGQTVVFSVQGRNVCQATTNSSGVASCKVTGLAVGPATYTATYAGDTDYLSSTGTAKL